MDGSVISPEEQLFELVRTKARYEVTRLEGEAEEVRAQVLKKRRERVLLAQADLQRISLLRGAPVPTDVPGTP